MTMDIVPKNQRFNTRRSNTEELVPGILTIQKPPKPRIRPAIDKERKKFLEEIRKKKAWMEKEDREWIPRSILKEKKKKAKTEKKKHNKLDDHPKEDTDNDIAASLETEGSDEDTEVDEEMELLYSDAESSEGSEFDVDEVGTEQPAALAVELGHLVKVGHKYKCFYCTKQCSSHDEVYSHIKVDHPDIDLDSLNKDELNCPVCGQHFKTLWRYLQHTSVCTTETYSRCKSCPLCDKATTDLSAHMKYYHHERNFKCQQCDKYFPRRYALKNHIKIVHVEEEFLCEICAVSVKSQAYLKTHMLMVHGTEEDKKHICETCGKKFFKKSTLNEHSKIHSKILDRECDFCDKKFYTKTALRNHENRNHMDMIDWKLSCDKCSKPFHTQHHLKRHIQMKHSGNKLKRKARKLKEEKPCKYRCAQCHLEFHIKCKFDSHAKWHENPCKCEFDNTVCWRSFATETGLHSHLEADHDIKNSQLTFICKMCDEVFKDIFLHRKHVAVEHEGKHLVDCDLCNCAFEKRKCLTGHKFKKHGITLSWKCSVCNLRFGSSNALIAHQTVHNGKRLVVCRLCGLVFGNTAYRQKHWVHVHKIRKLERPDDLSGLTVQPFILAKNIQSYKDTDETVHIPIDLDNPVIPHIEEESTPEFKHEGSGADSNIMPVKIADSHPPTSKQSENVLLPLNQSFIPFHSMDTILQSELPITGQVNPLIPGPEPVNPLIPRPEPVNPLIPCPEPVNPLIPCPEPINPLIPRPEPVNPLIPGPEPGNSDPSDIWL
ncbi:unnamed protein product [Owenia fusiformis]|uniref:Uncharacterized protein n=1 Tax=Owenia fusiformis TaxID=6347 RepID=A0A8J1XWU6_OWEFU|nr:unnamed protein product [Owenia fusiformis]